MSTISPPPFQRTLSSSSLSQGSTPRASTTSSSSLLPSNEIQLLTRKYPHFTPLHLIKLSKWFLTLSPASTTTATTTTNGTPLTSPNSLSLSPRTSLLHHPSRSSSSSSSSTPPILVEFDHLLNTLHSTSLLKNKKDFYQNTKDFEFSLEGLMTFDDFLQILTLNITQKSISLKKLIQFLDEDNMEHLSSNLILTMNRRKLLMEHIVNRSIIRGIGLDHASSTPPNSVHHSLTSSTSNSTPKLNSPSSTKNLRTQSILSSPTPTLRRQQSLEELAHLHDKQRKEASEVIGDLTDGIKRERELLHLGQRRDRKYRNKSTRNKELDEVFIPLEELITSSKLLPSLLGEEFKDLIDPKTLLSLHSNTITSSSCDNEPCEALEKLSSPNHITTSEDENEENDPSKELKVPPFADVDWISAVSRVTPRKSISHLPQLSPTSPSMQCTPLHLSPGSVCPKSTSSLVTVDETDAITHNYGNNTRHQRGKSAPRHMKSEHLTPKTPPPKLYQKSSSESRLKLPQSSLNQVFSPHSDINISPISTRPMLKRMPSSTSSPGSDTDSDMVNLSLGPLDGIHPIQQYTPVSDRSHSTSGSASGSNSHRKFTFTSTVLPPSLTKATEENIVRCTPFLVKPLSPVLGYSSGKKQYHQRPATTTGVSTSGGSPSWRR